MRARGHLEYLELKAYDLFVSNRSPAAASMAGEVVVVGINEVDIARRRTDGTRGLHYPVHDRELIEILNKVLQCQPSVVGIDIARDRPEPDTESNKENQVLKDLAENHPVFFSLAVAGNGKVLIEGPEGMEPTYLAAANFTPDPDGVVRRGMLFVRGDERVESYPSIAFSLAGAHLAQQPGLGPPRPTTTRPSQRERQDWVFGRTVLREFSPNDGGYVRTQPGGIEFLLDLRVEGPHAFRHFSASQILNGNFDEKGFAGKVVLVGMTADSVKDFLTTSKDASDTRTPWHGVDVHAAAVEQLLRLAGGARPTRFWPDWGEGLWTLAWGVLGGLVGGLFRSPWKLLPCVAAGAGLLYVTDRLAFEADWWLPFVPSLGAWGLSAFAVTSYVTRRERSDREMMMKLFGEHVSPEVARIVWDHREAFFQGRKIRSREMRATVLFTDLRGFSSVAEQMAAGEVMEWLNELMDSLTDCVSDSKGFLNKYIGDSIMAVFGAPVPSRTQAEFDRDAQNAVLSALGMRRALQELNRRWARRGLPTVGMRIGIFTGPVIAGSLGKAGSGGSAGRLEYTVIGDTVNTASRLESFDKALMDHDIAAGNCRILVGGPTLEHLRGRFQTRYIGTEVLKGKGGTVAVYGVIGEAEGVPPAEAGAHPEQGNGDSPAAHQDGVTKGV